MDTIDIIALLVLIAFIFGTAAYEFAKKTKEERIQMLIYWLREAVREAEEYFGSGTGQAKLARVYNAAVSQFPWLYKICDYEKFDKVYVKEALEWLEKQFENPNLKNMLGK